MDTLDSRYLTTYDASRHKADSERSYKLYFELVEQKIQQYEIQAQNMYNMDEKGFLIGFLAKSKRVFTKAALTSKRVLGAVQDGNREWITCIATICADGTSLSPGLIYKASTGNIQDTWLQDFDTQRHPVFFASSPNGWTSDKLGLSYLETIFDRESKAKARNSRDWRLLFVDGHGSHINMSGLDYCLRHRILIAVYPPHSTHRLQPLDVGLFAPLATYYSQALDQYLRECQAISSVSKRDFFRLFWQAYPQAFSVSNIQSGWSKTGLHPFNPAIVLDVFGPPLELRPPSQDSSSSSRISASDWRRIQALLKETIAQGAQEHDAKLKKLANTLDHVTTENVLLKAENRGMKQALYNEKKRRRRGKALFEEFRAQEGQGATFFSPAKIQAAKDLQTQREQAKEDEATQKVAKAEDRKQQKHLKEVAAYERKIQRQNQAQARKEAALAKAAQSTHAKEAKKASQQLQEALQASVKKQKRQQVALIGQNVTSDENNIECASEVLEQLNPARSRIRRRPAYLADFKIDY